MSTRKSRSGSGNSSSFSVAHDPDFKLHHAVDIGIATQDIVWSRYFGGFKFSAE